MEKVAYGRSIDEFVCITDTEKGKGKNLGILVANGLE
jgi:hypothetical protein